MNKDTRRKFLIRTLQVGGFSLGANYGNIHAGFFDVFTNKDSNTKSFYKIKGEVKVNGVIANEKTLVTANDTVETSQDSQAIFVVGQDAMLLRAKSKLKLTGNNKFTKRADKDDDDDYVVDTLRLITGAVLTVFGKTGHKVFTTNASIGIRGTGVYVESETNRSYICTCYGETVLEATNDSTSKEVLKTRHHDLPKYVLSKGEKGKLIIPAPVKNHSDLELTLLEELVGREVPAYFSNDSYSY